MCAAAMENTSFPLTGKLVCGLVLKVDLEAVLLPQCAPAGNCGV